MITVVEIQPISKTFDNQPVVVQSNDGAGRRSGHEQDVGDDDAVVVDVGHRVVDDVDAGTVRQVGGRIASYKNVLILSDQADPDGDRNDDTFFTTAIISVFL